jgi:hypothetical protein
VELLRAVAWIAFADDTPGGDIKCCEQRRHAVRVIVARRSICPGRTAAPAACDQAPGSASSRPRTEPARSGGARYQERPRNHINSNTKPVNRSSNPGGLCGRLAIAIVRFTERRRTSRPMADEQRLPSTVSRIRDGCSDAWKQGRGKSCYDNSRGRPPWMPKPHRWLTKPSR